MERGNRFRASGGRSDLQFIQIFPIEIRACVSQGDAIIAE
jgi:hypothetical protein